MPSDALSAIEGVEVGGTSGRVGLEVRRVGVDARGVERTQSAGQGEKGGSVGLARESGKEGVAVASESGAEIGYEKASHPAEHTSGQQSRRRSRVSDRLAVGPDPWPH